MLKRYQLLCLLLLMIFSCNREDKDIEHKGCIPNTQIPTGTYGLSSNVIVSYNGNHCGYLPLSKKNYWIYTDSSTDANGQLQFKTTDTLRFLVTSRTPDGIIWWSRVPGTANFALGYDSYFYSTDSTTYTISKQYGDDIGIKWFYAIKNSPTAEDLYYSDVSSPCNAQRLSNNVTVPAGSFSNCMFFVKTNVWGNGIEYKIRYKPGLGILRCEASLGTRIVYTSTLINYYIEQ